MFWFAFVFANIAASNFITGGQSIDQIVFGTTLGVWLGYFCNTFIRRPLDIHITKLLLGEYHAQGYSTILKCLLGIVIIDFILVSGIYALCENLVPVKTAQAAWLEEVRKECDPNRLLNTLMFAENEYANAFVQLICLGSYLGILCDTKFFKGTHREIHNTSILKGLVRTMLTLLIFSPFVAVARMKIIHQNYKFV